MEMKNNPCDRCSNWDCCNVCTNPEAIEYREQLKDKDNQYSCEKCGQFFLDKSWAYCPLCGALIEWYFMGKYNDNE
jgi:rubrerythrin